MARFGYTLFCEGNDPRDLVKQAAMAEEAGFDFLVISDHFHPWLPNQKHSGFAWSILGAITYATKGIQLATMVTCPLLRYHPALVAQMAATIGVLSEGRFVLGLGAGERLNEHIIGEGWPPVAERHRMLAEAIDIIKQLWSGDYISYEGGYFAVEDARIFDLPKESIPFFVAASGEASAQVAAQAGGGICMTDPNAETIGNFVDHGGDANDVWGQLVLSWNKDKQAALNTAHEQFRFSAGGWKVQAELPNPINFEAAVKYVRPEDLAEAIACGSDVSLHKQYIQQYLDAGVQNLAVIYPGTDHKGFMNFWKQELQPTL